MNETLVVRRGCTVGGSFTEFCAEEEKMDPDINCMWCHEDSCNISSHLSSALMVIFGAILFVIFIKSQ